MTAQGLDHCVLEILVEDRVLPEEQLDEARSILDKMRELGLKKDLLDVLIHREFLAPAAADTLRTRARFKQQQQADRLLARIITGGGLVPVEQVDEVLQVQEALFNARQEIRPLAEILQARGLLSDEERAWVERAVADGGASSGPPPRPRRTGPAQQASAPPPSRLTAEPPPARTGTKRLPAASGARRRRAPISARSLLLAGLLAGGVGATAGLFLLVRWFERSRVEEQFQQARALVARQQFLEAEEAFRKFIARHPQSSRQPDALLELQKLLINRAEVNLGAGMVEAAIERYRAVRLLDATTEPAREASKKLAELAGELARRERRKAWDAFEKSVRGRIASGAHEQALALLARPPRELTAAQQQALEALRRQAREALGAQALRRFVFVAPEKIKLPEHPPVRTVRPPSRPVRRFALHDDQPVHDGAGLARGVLLVPVGRTLQAVDAQTGRVLWERATGRGRSFYPVLPPAGEALASAGDRLRSLALVEARSGKARWERFFGSAVSCRPAVHPPHLFVGTEQGLVYQLRLDSGELKGAFPAGGEVLATPSYEPTGDLLLIPAGDGFLYLYELGSRRFLGRQAAQPHPGVPPIVLHPFLFVPRRVGGRTQLVVLQLEREQPSGARRLRRRTSFELEGQIRTPAAVLDGRVHCVTDAGVLGVYAVDPGREAKVYPLTRSAAGRSIAQSGAIQLQPTDLGRQLLAAGADLQLFDLPRPRRGDTSGYNVNLAWSYEAGRASGAPLHGQVEALLRAGRSVFCFSRTPGTQGVELYAFDLARRALVWRRSLNSGPSGAPARLHDPGPSDGRLVQLTQDGSLHCLCLDRGEVIYRRMSSGTRPLAGGRIEPVDARSLLVARGRALQRVDAVTAEPAEEFALSFALKSSITSGPTVAGGVAYFGTRGGAFHAIDAKSGRTRHDLFTNPGGRPFSTRPLVAGTTIVVGCLDRAIYGLQVKRIGGRSYLGEAWKIETGGEIHCDFVAAGGRVWAGSDDGKLYCIDPGSGVLHGTVQLPAAVRGPLALAGGKLFCGTEDFQLNAIDITTRKLAWRVALEGKLRARPATADGLLYLATTTGLLLALDGEGQPRWRLSLPERFEEGALSISGKSLYLVSRSGYLYEVQR